jgi:hypothetical protein
MPSGDADAGREHPLRTLVQRTVEDHLHRPADELGPAPDDQIGHAVGPAAKAGAEAGRLRGGGETKSNDVLLIRPRAATRPAVDPRRHDRRERLHGARYSVPHAAALASFGQALPIRRAGEHLSASVLRAPRRAVEHACTG